MKSPLDPELRELGRAEANLARRIRELENYDGDHAEDWTAQSDSSLHPLREAVRQAELNLAEARAAYEDAQQAEADEAEEAAEIEADLVR